ncbi:retrovirus-related pol polyprotein from transposon TNT 1-94 [Tanacetum coccineum]
MGIMPTKTELALEQTQQGVSNEVLNIRVILHNTHSDNGNPTSANIKQALRQVNASPSSEVMPLTYQEHSLREKPGLGIMKYTKSDTQESSSKSDSGPRPVTVCTTESVITSVPTEIDNNKQESKINELTKLVQMLINEKVDSSQKIQESKPRHIRESIWYLDSRCLRSMTDVKSYLHKYVHQLGPKVVFGDNSSCITEGYGSINCGGISHNFSSPYTPEQNGVAERNNRTLIEADRTMLNESTRFTNTSADEIRIDDSSRYPHDELLHEDDLSRKYQENYDISYYITPHNRSLIELIETTQVPEVITPNEKNIPHIKETEGPPDLINTKGIHEQTIQNEQVNNQPTDEHPGDNTETLISIIDLLVPNITQSPIIYHASTSMLTRSMTVKLIASSASECLFADFLFEIEPKKVYEALKHPWWVDAMQEELNQNKKYELRTVTRNKSRLVAQGYSQEKGIDYDETFASVSRIEAIRIFLAFATYINFKVFQMDVKSAFLNEKLKEEVYVKQPLGFESSEFPNYVCKLDKALYGLKQAPKAWYLKGTPTLGLWYPKCSGFDLKGYSDSNYVGCNMDKKSTSGACQLLRGKLADHPTPLAEDSEARPLKESNIKFIVENGKTPLILDYKTFCQTTGLEYNNGNYVAHPFIKEVKAELAKIDTHDVLLHMTPLLKVSFPAAWRILMTFVIEVLGGNHSSTKLLNSNQQLIVYSLLTRTKIDTREIIYNDLVTRLMAKSRQKYVSYPRSLRLLEHSPKKGKKAKTKKITLIQTTLQLNQQKVPLEATDTSQSMSSG